MDETIWTPEINIPTDNHPELVDLTHLQEQERSALLLHHETQRQSVVAEASQTLQEQLNDFDRRNHTVRMIHSNRIRMFMSIGLLVEHTILILSILQSFLLLLPQNYMVFLIRFFLSPQS